ncbi:hypothetical protein [Larkinella terrae]|uniref:Uncharacterized protein n=1 Tax=Larkinella terrae TaxID=2025311 RepID=A0A7K0ERJ1_9BACT|nr:hypothetical protein [Larkinella terrae]MRS64389.1 hypothetical protein [Larkinella terrae]
MQTNRSDFLELLQRYMDGSCSSEEKQMMDYWYDLLDQENEDKNGSLPRHQLEELLWAKILHRTQAEKETDNQTIHLKWWQHDG